MKIFLILLFFIVNCFILLGQDKKFNVKCGDVVEEEFTKDRDWHAYYIQLDGGDNLKVYSYPKYGETLKYNIDITDAEIRFITRDIDYKSIHQIETGKLPGAGTYVVHPYNYLHNLSASTGFSGNYIIEFSCETANGREISPENKANESEKEIVVDQAEFFSIPFGTAMEGEITAGSNQLFGFRTKINRNTQAILDFSIVQGSTPLEIQILDPSDKSVIFSSSLGYAGSIQAKIKFPDTQEYIVLIKESFSKGGSSGNTKFSISIK